MTVDELTNKLLFVPFNNDYKVEQSVKDLLTEEEFFEECFIEPSFDKAIKEALANSNEEVNDFELDFDKADIISRLDLQKEDAAALDSWIESKQPQIYCIRGDAGTGKTTYLHYLKYKYKNRPVSWNIIDIQNATNAISFLGKYIKIPMFETLYSKSISAILFTFANSVFERDKNNRISHEKSAFNIKALIKTFNQKFDCYYPREEIFEFFTNIPYDDNNCSNDNCKNCSEFFANWSKNILNDTSLEIKEKFSIILELFIYFLTCIKGDNHIIISFDNFERFIGTDEIYNGQLTEFVSELRAIQNTTSTNNPAISQQYQIMIFMRNTSVRMFTSQQVTEFFAHTIDLSDWFDASSVLKKKIEWYNTKNIVIDGTENLLNIFNDMGECGETLRGLHFKISMLFNYNKRIVIRFLARILLATINEPAIQKYEHYWKNCEELKPSLNKFAARSIIYRLILNELRKDGFFINIVAQKADSKPEYNSLGCARKILSILYDHYINSQNNADSRYMSLIDLISNLYSEVRDPIKLLFDKMNEKRLDLVSKVLFHMNYYDGRKDNWLQLIDIQYNLNDNKKIIISDSNQLKNYIKKNPENIKVRITHAGMAYLYFVVYHFEFFSCKSTDWHSKPDVIKKDTPPLLCVIPLEKEIMEKELSSLQCIKIINLVLEDSLECISEQNNTQNPIPFHYKPEDPYITHQQRIVNSHRGYLDNFIECIKLLYKAKAENDKKFDEKLKELISEITAIRNKYKVEYGIEKISEGDKI